MTIDELALKHGTDKSSLDHQYTQFYQKHFDRYINNPKKILELGIYTTTTPPLLDTSGASLKTWAEYYPECMIYGLDLIDFTILDKNYKNIKTMGCNCQLRDDEDILKLQNLWLVELFTDPKYNMIGGKVGLNHIEKEIGTDFDIIIDDGPHTMSGQQIFLGYMFKHLKSGGLFIIEDLATSRESWGSTYNSYPFTEKNTLWMIEYFIKNNKMVSDFILPDELEYLNNNIAEIHLEKGKNSEIAFIVKK
jgi:hypothetical protein